MKQPLLLTTRQTALLLNVSERTVFSLAKSGQLKPRRIGRRVLFPRAMIEEFARG